VASIELDDAATPRYEYVLSRGDEDCSDNADDDRAGESNLDDEPPPF
jgi:hypothetical protein